MGWLLLSSKEKIVLINTKKWFLTSSLCGFHFETSLGYFQYGIEQRNIKNWEDNYSFEFKNTIERKEANWPAFNQIDPKRMATLGQDSVIAYRVDFAKPKISPGFQTALPPKTEHSNIIAACIDFLFDFSMFFGGW